LNEGALWEQVIDGDQEAFGRLYSLYGPPVRSFVRHYLGDPGVVDDLVQDTFLQLWRKPNGFNPERGTLKQYLFGIARNRAAQWRRETPPRPTNAAPFVEPATNNTVEVTLVRMALKQLDKDDRGLLWLREIEGYSYSELAGMFGIPVGTVKSRLFSAREALRHVWRKGAKL
jgi:RNA polymerase sigma-70 factor (ECF subfamily)